MFFIILTMDKKFKFSKWGIILFLLVLLLAVFGVLMVYSASKYVALNNYNDQYFFMKKQITGVLLGLVGMIAFSFIPIEKIRKFDWIILLVGLIMLALVFVPGVGKSNYGATRWIGFGSLTIQPSEIAKFSFIFFSASRLSKVADDAKKFKALLPTLIAGGLTCLFIILEPNMSITMCVGLSMLVMLFVGGASFKHFIILLVPIILAVPLLIVIEPYRMQRLSAYLDPWSAPLGEGFQLIQSYYALGSGGWTGLGFGESRQKNLFLPFAESDFIFSIIGEEFGFIVSVIVIIIYVIVIFAGLKIASRAKTRFLCYLTTGIVSLIAIQTLLNIAVVTGSIPPTGLPLPFISAGSTSLLVFMSAIGVVLNVHRQSRKSRI